MKIVWVITVWATVVAMGSPAFAGDLNVAVARAVEQQEQQAQPRRAAGPGVPKAYLWPGTALFVGGMAVALNGFLNNRNGEFPEFGEANATNVRMGAAGLAAAFGGGLLLFLGREKAPRASALVVAPGRVELAHRLRW
jgi:hypothetical protein